jgi:hypothetical protein
LGHGLLRCLIHSLIQQKQPGCPLAADVANVLGH